MEYSAPFSMKSKAESPAPARLRTIPARPAPVGFYTIRPCLTDRIAGLAQGPEGPLDLVPGRWGRCLAEAVGGFRGRRSVARKE